MLAPISLLYVLYAGVLIISPFFIIAPLCLYPLSFLWLSVTSGYQAWNYYPRFSFYGFLLALPLSLVLILMTGAVIFALGWEIQSTSYMFASGTKKLGIFLKYGLTIGLISCFLFVCLVTVRDYIKYLRARKTND